MDLSGLFIKDCGYYTCNSSIFTVITVKFHAGIAGGLFAIVSTLSMCK